MSYSCLAILRLPSATMFGGNPGPPSILDPPMFHFPGFRIIVVDDGSRPPLKQLGGCVVSIDMLLGTVMIMVFGDHGHFCWLSALFRD